MSLIDNVLGKLFGNKSERDIKSIQPIVDETIEIYESLKNISNDELRERSVKLKTALRESVQEEQQEIDRLKEAVEKDEVPLEEREAVFKAIDDLESQVTESLEESLNNVLPEAFAIMRETARRFKENETIEVKANDFDRQLALIREYVVVEGDKASYANNWLAGGNRITWDMVHYEVQLIGGIVLHQGKIAEMATGEGKTLVATLPVFLNALTGRGVHIVTVNNYLARRDAEWMGPLFEFHGLSVDCIDNHKPNSDKRRAAYAADITYGTNNEFGFDYLRDNMALSPGDLVQRGHNYTIVDEVDSVLIDDARTPLIISGPVPRGDKQLFDEFKPKVSKLATAQRKLCTQLLSDARKLIKKGDTNEGAILLLRAYKGLPKMKALIKFLSEDGMRTLMTKTENVYLAENQKRMPEITDDLYFVIEEKTNSVDLTDKGIDLISKDTEDANFFVMPDIGSEIAEIEKSGAMSEEKLQKKDVLLADYAIKSERIHTINQLLKAYTLFEKDVEYVVIDNKVKIVDEQTGRIMDGRRYSDGLHQAIEAKENVKVEAATQTFATITLQNYFRMYNKLAGMTGTAETEAGEFWDIYELDVVVIPTNLPIVRDDRQDLVYKTKREKYTAVIDEVVDLVEGGRPVLVGTTSVEISELLSRMLKMQGLKHNVLNAKLHAKEADVVAEAGQAGNITIATNMAGRGTDIKLTKEVKAAGGLAIIGTERHESRRVDRQLRGRAGRQGDPGSSQFFVSLEDDLMRLFGSDRISKLMDRMGHQDGEVIQHNMISKSIERAQKKVEENNFGIRKRLLEYDDVMNSQREVIYRQRRHALFGERISLDIMNMLSDVCESIVDQCHGLVDFNDFNLELIRSLSIESPIDEATYLKAPANEIIKAVYDALFESYKRKTEGIRMQALPVISDVYKRHSSVYKNIVVPMTDGYRLFHITVSLEKAFESEAREVVKAFERQSILMTIDEAWKEHLREMDDLKQSVQNATYEQKDPLLIYKFEAFELFKQMIDRNNKSVISNLLKVRIHDDREEVRQAQTPKKLDMSKYQATKSDVMASDEQKAQREAAGQGQGGEQTPRTVRRDHKKIGRNDRVRVKYTDGRVLETKYKKVENDIEAGTCVLLETM